MTLAQYFRTPETVVPQELAYGVLRVADAPKPRHQAVVGDFYVALREHVHSLGLGRVWLSPIDVVLDADRDLVVQPDLLFVSNSRADIIRDRICGAPDLVLEVLSPLPRVGKLDERLGWFATYGVREAWLVHQLRRRVEVVSFARGTIAARRGHDASTPIDSVVLPEFRRSVDSVLGGCA
jgi:Uma2 family endonuclease